MGQVLPMQKTTSIMQFLNEIFALKRRIYAIYILEYGN